tara:strand:+ start:192 stop:518 length:327 start_codon:yes stop_codon:yes gene_type:complete
MKAALAVNLGETLWGNDNLGDTFPNLSTLVSLILNNSLTIVGVLLLALLIFGGLTFIMGAGGDDPKKVQQGQKTITNALLGFIIVFLAYFIIQIIEVLTGLEILNSNI